MHVINDFTYIFCPFFWFEFVVAFDTVALDGDNSYIEILPYTHFSNLARQPNDRIISSSLSTVLFSNFVFHQILAASCCSATVRTFFGTTFTDCLDESLKIGDETHYYKPGFRVHTTQFIIPHYINQNKITTQYSANFVFDIR